jgi:tetratricopeptide (TPR) repeat protein
MQSPVIFVVVARWSGQLAAALREALRMTEAEFARYWGASPRAVAGWEAHPAVVPVRVMQEALDTALARATDEQKARFIGLISGQSLVVVADSVVHVVEEAGTDRRYVLQTAAAGLTTLVPLDALERITHAVSGPVDAALVADHERFADALAGLHNDMRPDVLAGSVARQADLAFHLLDLPMPTSLRRRLDVIAVELHAQAANLAFAVGDRTAARRYYALAQSVADDSGDATLRAQALGVSSRLHSPELHGWRGGNNKRAVELLSKAADYARAADVATQIWVHQWLAVELAAGEDEAGYTEHIAVADRFDRPTDRGYGYFARGFEGGSTDRNVGEGLALLGHADEAIASLSRATNFASPRAHICMLVMIALARVAQRQPEQACADLTQAHQQSLDLGYVSGVQRILGVRDRFPPPWAPLACVQELDERLGLVRTVP